MTNTQHELIAQLNFLGYNVRASGSSIYSPTFGTFSQRKARQILAEIKEMSR